MGKKNVKKFVRTVTSLILSVAMVLGCFGGIIPQTAVQEVKAADKLKVIGYLPSYRSYTIDSIDYSALTHLNLSFMTYQNGQLKCGFSDADVTRIVNKCKANNVKVMIALGGGGGFDTSSQPFSTAEKRTSFINQLMNYVDSHGLDGVDIDIEVTDASIWSNFDAFISELSGRLKAENKLLTMAVSSWFTGSIQNSTYNYFDFVNLMTYDENAGSGPVASMNFVQQQVSHYQSKGISADRLTIGVPFYGYGSGGYSDAYTYAQLYDMNANEALHNTSGVYNNIWFDSADVIRSKAEYCKNYGGIMIWELGQDKYDANSLLKVIKDTLGDRIGDSSSTDTPVTPSYEYFTLADGDYYFTCAQDNKIVTAAALGDELVAKASASSYTGNSEKFTVVNNGDGTVAIRSAANNKYLCQINDGDNRLSARTEGTVDTWEKFYLVKINDTQFAFMSYINNKFVTANMNGDGTMYATNASIGGAWETFTATAAPATSGGNNNNNSNTGGSSSTNSDFKLIGYYPDWYGDVTGSVQLEKYTHVNYAFAIPDANGNIQSFNGTQATTLIQKAHAKGVKVIVSVGGWSYNGVELESTFAAATNTDAKCQTLANNILNLVDQYGFDGADIDWEYPRSSTSGQYDKLMTYLRTGLDQRGKVLTAAVACTSGDGYSSTALGKLDWINIMAYDGDSGAGHSPYSYATAGVEFWKNKGVPANKIVLGVPFYARNSWGAYGDIVAADSANAHKDSTYINGQTVYYNGLETMAQKTEYACKNAAGIMVWEMTQDSKNAELSLLNKIIETKNSVLGQQTGGNESGGNENGGNQSGTGNSQQGIPENPGYVKPSDIDKSILANSEFTNGTTGWTKSTTNDGAGDLTVESNRLVAKVDKVGSAAWAYQIFQENLTLEKGKKYHVYVSVTSSVDRSIRVAVENYTGGAVTALSGQTVALTANTPKVIEFTTDEITETISTGKMYIGLGQVTTTDSAGTVVFDCISLAPVTSEDSGDSDDKETEDTTIAVTGVTLNKTTAELTQGNEVQLTATVAPANASNKNVSWETSNASVATVENGLVKAIAPGNATITVKTADGNQTASCQVTVIKKTIAVTDVVLSSTKATLYVGDTDELQAKVYPENADNQEVRWTSSNTDVVTVDNGVITAVGAGEANVTVTTVDQNITKTCVVTVVEEEDDSEQQQPGGGDTENSGNDSDDNNGNNNSGNENTGNQGGSTTPVATKITVSPLEKTMYQGFSTKITITVTPEGADIGEVAYASSDENVAYVENGTIFAKNPGQAVITVSCGKKKFECLIHVLKMENISSGDGETDGDNTNTNPGGSTDEDNSNTNPGGSTGGDNTNTNPGGSTGEDNTNTNPGGSTGGDNTNTNPGGSTGGDNTNTNPGGTTGGDNSNTNPGGTTGGDNSNTNPGGTTGGNNTTITPDSGAEGNGSTGNVVTELVNISKATVSGISEKATYTGKGIVYNSIVVTYNGVKLTKGTDYTVLYSNNTDCGKATVTIQGIGKYTGSKTVHFVIQPAKVKSVSAKRSGGKVKVSWKKSSGKVSGYRIQYSRYKSMKGKRSITTTSRSKTLKLKAGTTYYIRVCAYVKVDGKKVYGSYSTVKKVKK